jgi:hypothetical protein
LLRLFQPRVASLARWALSSAWYIFQPGHQVACQRWMRANSDRGLRDAWHRIEQLEHLCSFIRDSITRRMGHAAHLRSFITDSIILCLLKGWITDFGFPVSDLIISSLKEPIPFWPMSFSSISALGASSKHVLIFLGCSFSSFIGFSFSSISQPLYARGMPRRPPIAPRAEINVI